MISERLFLALAALAFSFLSVAFFASVKIIFSSIAGSYIPPSAERLRHFAPKIQTLLDEKERFSLTVSCGKLFMNTLYILLLFILIQNALKEAGVTTTALIAFCIGIVTLGLFATIIPRVYAESFYLSHAPAAYIIYTCFSWLFFPVVLVLISFRTLLLKVFKYDAKLAFLLEQEKEMLKKANATPTALNREEQAMIHSIFELKKTTVDEIMVPRVNVEGLDIGASLPTTLGMIKEKGHSRIPIYTGTIDSITGILYAKDLISWIAQNSQESWNLANLLKKPLFVPLSKKIDDLMREFKRRHLHIAVVVDEYGGTAGMVTMEDILEEIVGEINDEYDTETKAINKISETRYLVDPQIDLYDLAEALHVGPLHLQEAQYNTLGGLIYHEVGAIPAVNTEFEFQGLRIKVIAMDNQRIEKAEIEVLEKKAEGSDSEATF